MRLHPGYALAAAAVFAIEVAIALFAHDAFIRPYVGDALAVVLVYAAFRAATRLNVAGATATALAIAFGIEIGQYFNLVDHLGLAELHWVALVLGNGFDPEDFLAYTAGAALILAIEALRSRAP